MRAGGAAVLLVFGVAVACGGRTHFLDPDQTDDASGSSGAASRGSTASTGGKTSGAGAFGAAGTLNLNRSGSSGATAGGSNCLCEPLEECEPGYYREPNPKDCCAGGPCVLDCRDVGCPDIELDCQPGTHVGTLPGQCCPSCVPNTPPPCETAKKLYAEFRADTLAKHWAQGCSAQGCAMAGENNRCAVSCGFPVPTVALNSIEEELGLFAEATCSECPLPTEPVCLPTPPLQCAVNECTFTPTQ